MNTRPIHPSCRGGELPPVLAAAVRPADLPGEVTLPARASAEQRERVATAALAGLIAQRAGHEQHQFDRAATTAVRYADALLDALNRSTAEAMHHARTR